MTTDPIQLELFRNLFEAAADEMGLTLQRVAFSANIKERRDFSCALFSPQGDLLAQAAHIPVHLGSMPASLAAVLDRLGPLHEGDVAIVNDPFAGGTHLPDITIVTPIFSPSPTSDSSRDTQSNLSPLVGEGRGEGMNQTSTTSQRILVGYAANRAHHADVGGSTPGSMTLSRHIDEEGLRIEPSMLFRSGVRDEQLLGRILSAVRTPDERLGDLDAQFAANHVGAAALQRMIHRHGLDSVQHYGQALLDYSQSFMAKTIAAIPKGQYAFEDHMDDDGAGTTMIPIRAIVQISGDRATVDLRDCPDQVPGCINCPAAVTRSAAYYCFACLLESFDVPFNAGIFRNIEVLTRPGSLLHAQYPAAVVAGNTETSQRIVDVIFGALAQALPERIPAASCGTMSSLALGALGTQESALRSQNWTYYETIGGGSGASPADNGAHAVQCHMTNTLNTPAEALEMQYPLRVLRFERATGAGGEGAHQGGDGILREIQALGPCEGTILSDRRTTSPYPIAGGKPASRGLNRIIHPSNQQTHLPAKCHFTLQPDDRLQIRTPGGGGWGQ
jgi:N-methylhydantoinase B